jgi:hypothetical protein
MARRCVLSAMLALSSLVTAATAQADGWVTGPPTNPGTNVYPPAGSGPPGSAMTDLMNYRRTHSRHSSTEQICPGAQGDCAPVDIDVTFSGQTALTVDVTPDAFWVIAGIGAQELSCKTLSAVKAEVLKGADVPPNDLATAMAAPSDYERWTATLCGQPVAFLLGVWPADGKQSPFRIVYPFAP